MEAVTELNNWTDSSARSTSQPTSVLHIVNGEFYAGAERVQDLLALRLPEFGYQVIFSCLKNGLFCEKRKAKEATLHRFTMRSKLDLWIAFGIARLARQNGCCLIHTHTARGALVGQLVARLSGLPMVHHVHSPTMVDTETAWRNIRNSMAERLSLAHAARLISVSQQLQTYLHVRGFEIDRTRTVWNGVPMREMMRRPYRAGEPLVIGTVALFRPRKGIETLLQAMARLVQSGQDIHLHAVGPFERAPYRDSVLHLAGELGISDRIRWTGFTEDPAEEYRHMHVFVLPSLFGEGLPMAVLEAMSAGLPIVCTRVEGISEVIRDGRDGLLVHPGNIDDLADALRGLVTGEIDGARLGDSGWLRQREVFSDVAMAKGVAAVYREVIENHRSMTRDEPKRWRNGV